MTDLVTAARAVRERAYAPYSRFLVGCAIRTASGAVFVGANVENAAYPQGLCAERSAVAAMVAAGEQRIAEVVVVGNGAAPCAPCGGCRQLLSEFAPGDTAVHMLGSDGGRRTATMGELLPYAFGPLALGAGIPPTPTAAGYLKDRFGDGFPKIAVVLGSGLGGFADRLEAPTAVGYDELEGFPRPSVEGHVGRLVVGTCGGVPVATLQGRVHVYEGQGTGTLATLVRALREVGVRVLILTNASGAIAAAIRPGTIALITDHINMLGTNPLIGPNDQRHGPRFPDMSAVYDAGLRGIVAASASSLRLEIASGVYLATTGPSFETPAEIRAFRALGADLVGMSTVPEAILARHAGLKVLGLSVVTNIAAGLRDAPLSHAETLAMGEAAAGDLERLLTASLPEIATHAA
ncbi:MAG: purine-nucleoside phosphorylase [Geminicoccaceae bacterium]|jgi:xanthosine phosphorylase|nr:purine-nucleoside phosphorylase [Geminicoccaceae bacterium]